MSFFENKTVYENLKYILKIRQFSEAEQESIVNKSIIDFKLEQIRDEKIKNLSLYNKYLLSLVRLTYRKLDILLIDNIFEELTDDENKKIISFVKKYFIKQTPTVVFATSSENIANSLSTRKELLSLN